MWLIASEVSVRLEFLNSHGECQSSSDARLVSLDDSCAVITLVRTDSNAAARIGAPIRFSLEDGMRRYEVTGEVVRECSEGRAGHPRPQGRTEPSERCELSICVWECKLCVQRRVPPRRRLGFPVELRVLDCEEGTEESLGQAIAASCVDVGAGGIRVRTSKLEAVPSRMQLEFCLPVADEMNGAEEWYRFCLAGRVLRTVAQGGQEDNLDIAFCFEALSVRDGMALHNLLS